MPLPQTDPRPLLDLLQRNLEHNKVDNVHAAELDWGTDIVNPAFEGVDMILAADCVYFEVGLRVLSAKKRRGRHKAGV